MLDNEIQEPQTPTGQPTNLTEKRLVIEPSPSFVQEIESRQSEGQAVAHEQPDEAVIPDDINNSLGLTDTVLAPEYALDINQVEDMDVEDGLQDHQ